MSQRIQLVKSLEKGMNTKFMTGFKEAPRQWAMIADFVSSDQNIETYPWLGSLPDPEVHGEEVKRSGIAEYFTTIPNVEYSRGITVKRSVFDDNQYGSLERTAGAWGSKVGKWFNKKTFETLAAGETATAYDGQLFFDTDHSEGKSGTQSNKGTTALSTASFNAAYAAMQNFKDDQGDPVGITPNLLVVPPALRETAMAIVKATTIETGSNGAAVDNAGNKNLVEVLVSPYLTDANNWYLLDTTADSPIIFQERIALETGIPNKDKDTLEYSYDMYWRGAFGYGDWRKAYGAIVA